MMSTASHTTDFLARSLHLATTNVLNGGGMSDLHQQAGNVALYIARLLAKAPGTSSTQSLPICRLPKRVDPCSDALQSETKA